MARLPLQQANWGPASASAVLSANSLLDGGMVHVDAGLVDAAGRVGWQWCWAWWVSLTSPFCPACSQSTANKFNSGGTATIEATPN